MAVAEDTFVFRTGDCRSLAEPAGHVRRVDRRRLPDDHARLGLRAGDHRSIPPDVVDDHERGWMFFLSRLQGALGE